MNPYVFFVGCPRSGTTLVQRMGDAHFQLAVLNELHWVPRWWERGKGIRPDGTVTSELVQRLVRHSRFTRLGFSAERVAQSVRDGDRKHYADFVTELFDLHGEVKGKRLVGEKTPKYVRFLPTLHALWPHAKVVHLIRDGRDVALSLLDWDKAERNVGRFSTWNEDPVTSAALYWEWNVRLGRQAEAFLGPELYHELRYEALVADPETESMKLCEFLGLAYDPAMLRFHEGRRKAQPGLSAKRAWRPVTGGLRAWREQMAADDVRRFEAAAGPLLAGLAYERAIGSVSDDERARAERLREEFAETLRSHRWPTPRAWERVLAGSPVGRPSPGSPVGRPSQ